MARTRPTLFIGSSTEGLKIAKALQVLLEYVCEVTIGPLISQDKLRQMMVDLSDLEANLRTESDENNR